MPPHAMSVVVIDSDSDSIDHIVRYIRNLGNHATVDGVAANFEGGFELIHKKRPMVVIMEITPNDLEVSIDRIKTILNRFPQVSIFATCEDRSSDTILRVMRAGVAEYILRPVSEVDFASALQKLGRLWIVKPSAEAEEGSIYTIFSPKGGVGVTTLSINLAVSVHDITNKPTVLVDLDLNAGDVTTFLNLKPTYTINDVTMNMSRLDKSFLQGVITKHESGIYVLAEPQKVEEGVSISAGDVKKVLSLLKTMFKYIILDTEPVFNERTMTATEMSDLVLLTFIMSLPGIRNMQRYLSYLEKIGIRKDKIRLVVNRYLKKGDIKLEDAEKVLNHPIFWSVPNEYNTAMASLNKGVPVNNLDPRSKLNLAIKELAITMVTSKKQGGSQYAV